MGRWVIAWFFLSAAWERAEHWNATIQMMALQHLPAPPLLLALALIVMVLGGLSLVLGYQTRHGAMLLFGFTIAVTLLMYDFWHAHDAIDRAADYDLFARNIAIAGGLLLLVGMGPGPLAFDNRGNKKKSR
jgi:putative oxidoreductase